MSITVHSASQISAQQWVSLIQKSAVPDFIKKDIKAQGNAILGPSKFKQPKDLIPLEWLDDFAKAFTSDAWEVTTAMVEFQVQKEGSDFRVRKEIFIDLEAGASGPITCFKSGPGEIECSPTKATLFQSFKLNDGTGELDFGQTFSSATVGDTLQVRLKSKRALVMVINRIQVFGLTDSQPPQKVGWRQIPVPDNKLLSTFFHEFAAHAARMLTKGKPAGHDNHTVNRIAEEAEQLVPETKPFDDVLKALNQIAQTLVTGPQPSVRPRAPRLPGPVRP